MATSPALLTYCNETLYASDLSLLEPGKWLNDKLISFYCEYLENTLSESATHHQRLVFINPDAVMMIKFLAGEDLKESLSPLNVAGADVVFFPINDSEDHSAVGGTHWSLLVWIRARQEFLLLDSHKGMNERASLAVVQKVVPLLNLPNTKVTVNAMETPQQVNGSDCGVYVLALCEYLATHTYEEYSKKLTLTPTQVAAKRTEIKNLLLTLAQDAQVKKPNSQE
eukprot:TRINITY_DN9920_c0_g1_i1.p1 TRINITY_DN9920_c0_g1~~TRINITY_DN9920_c0_g1_i1.p1  ORF type:complete len:225 (+),score=46.43 TRINITY_DN9920_c0_g1_i1:225-899(+)